MARAAGGLGVPEQRCRMRPPYSEAPVKSFANVSPASVGWAMAGLLVAVHGVAVWLQLVDAEHAQIVSVLIEGLVYTGAAYLSMTARLTASPGMILAIATVLRISLLFFEPYHSTDIYRYVWDGRVQDAGINPYLYIPDDHALSGLRDTTIWPNINRADYAHTIYPPAAEALFFLATRVSETTVWMKMVLLAFEAGTIAVLLRLLDGENLPRQRILLYAWSPLPVWEFSGGGHVDAAMMACAVTAVLLRRRGVDFAAGAALGLAILVKLFPLVLAPALWRPPQRRLPLACVMVIALGYLAYSGAGAKVLGFLPGYVGEEGIGDGHGFWLVSLSARVAGVVIPALVYLAAAAALMGAVALRILLRPEVPGAIFANCLALAATGMVVLSPAYPWYFCWLVPFLCFVPSVPVFWLTGSAVVLYWGSISDFPWMPDIVYGGYVVAAAADFARRFFIRQPSRSFT